MYGGHLKEVEFVGMPETMTGKMMKKGKKMKKKMVPIGTYASKKDIIQF